MDTVETDNEMKRGWRARCVAAVNSNSPQDDTNATTTAVDGGGWGSSPSTTRTVAAKMQSRGSMTGLG